MKAQLFILFLVLGLALATEGAAAIQPLPPQDLLGTEVTSDPSIVPSQTSAYGPTTKSWDAAFPFSDPLALTGDRWAPDDAFHPQEQPGSPEAPGKPNEPEQPWMGSPDAGCPPGAPCGPAGSGRPWQQSPEGDWFMPEGAPPLTEAAAAMAPQAIGGPDDFGYTWDDSVPLNWIDATTGADTGMGGSSWGQKVGPVNLPFPFKYYENSYGSLYIAASGYLAFTDEGTWPSQSQLPSPGKPNNVIAPYWTPLDLATAGPSGRIYYKSGGVAPNRYFVVEWYQVVRNDETYTYEVILHENSDIVFQYQAMTYVGGYFCGAAGIEDSTGLDGLAYVDFCDEGPPIKPSSLPARPPRPGRASGRRTRAALPALARRPPSRSPSATPAIWARIRTA